MLPRSPRPEEFADQIENGSKVDVQADLDSPDRLLVANSGRRGENEPSLTASFAVAFTEAADFVHSQNKKDTVVMPKKNQPSKKTCSKCIIYGPLRDAGASAVRARLYVKTSALGIVQMFYLKLQVRSVSRSLFRQEAV
jgi:hypothetical protein